LDQSNSYDGAPVSVSEADDTAGVERPMTDGEAPAPLAEEDALRAHFYGLLARLLGGQPDDATLEMVRALDGDDETPVGTALRALAEIARRTPKAKVDEEYGALFHGYGAGGEVMPYASRYLTGFLYEKPLADVRADLSRLGIGAAKTDEPEDHIAFLFEVMHGLITGAFGAPQPLDVQKAFFDKHIAPWAGRMFKDLEGAKSAVLYMPLAQLGQLFMAIEAEAFEMGR
jgi:TorA maturation chaperone TorD